MVVGVFGALLVTIWHFHADFQGKKKMNNQHFRSFNVKTLAFHLNLKNIHLFICR